MKVKLHCGGCVLTFVPLMVLTFALTSVVFHASDENISTRRLASHFIQNPHFRYDKTILLYRVNLFLAVFLQMKALVQRQEPLKAQML